MTSSRAQVYAALPFGYEEVLALAGQLRAQDISEDHRRAVVCAAEFLGVLSGRGEGRRSLAELYSELGYWVGKCRCALVLHPQQGGQPVAGQDPVAGPLWLADITRRVLIPLFETGVALELAPALHR
ncbi:hypothetical protein [Streptomyces sp. NPDC126514]|uniref:hypothetical protein n=1 Tax=Streptomyces sp. NPDC126514 TaxID=3155210 RepID=UPI0033277887